MGLIRALLAISVVDFHWAFTINGPGFWPLELPNGVIAVQAFYVISGFYMSLVLSGKYRDRKLAFYEARALRLLPTYWIVAIATILAVWLTGTPHYTPPTVLSGVWYVFSNVTLIGQDWNNFFAFPDLLPQTWTLGLEITFYVFAPFLARANQCSACSSRVQYTGRATAYAYGFSYDPWNYRFFPFELAWFLAGMLVHRCTNLEKPYRRRP